MVAATAAHADALFDKYFANADGGTPCYTRVYDAQHLKRKPHQKTKQITLALNRANAGSATPSDPGQFEVRLGLMIKNRTEFFTSPAYCSAERGGFLCGVEGDGGQFRIRPGSGDGLTLEVVGDGLRLEGETGAIEIGGHRSDDNLFTLPHVEPKQCSSIVDR